MAETKKKRFVFIVKNEGGKMYAPGSVSVKLIPVRSLWLGNLKEEECETV